MPDPRHDVHADHDLEVLAALADRSVDATTRARAEALVERCPDCRAIADDLRSLTASLATLPASRPAPRDMRLSPGAAARAHRGAGLRRVLRPFGRAAWAPLRPVGASLAALGLAGILITAAGGALGPTAASAPAASAPAAGGAFGAVPAASAGSRAADQEAPGASPVVVEQHGGSEAASSAPVGPHTDLGLASAAPTELGFAPSANGAAAPGVVAGPTDSGAASAPGLPPLTLGSIAALAAGLVMLGLRVAARRVA